MTDEWHIQIDQRYPNTESGTGTRAKEHEFAGSKGTTRRFVERLIDTKAQERRWRRGTERPKTGFKRC